MIIGIGTDLMQLSRLQNLSDTALEQFVKGSFTEAEIRQAQERGNWKLHYYATRFCAKEAMFKSISTMVDAFIPNEIQTIDDENGKPHITLMGKTGMAVARALKNNYLILASLSYDTDNAIAMVILEKNDRK